MMCGLNSKINHLWKALKFCKNKTSFHSVKAHVYVSLSTTIVTYFYISLQLDFHYLIKLFILSELNFDCYNKKISPYFSILSSGTYAGVPYLLDVINIISVQCILGPIIFLFV